MKSADYKSVDRQMQIHELAYLTMCAKAQKQVGKKMKSVYKTFKDFYDYEKELQKVEGNIQKEEVSSRFQRVAKYLSEKQKEKARKG